MGIRSLKTASISTGAKRSKFWDQSTTLFYSDMVRIDGATVSGSSTTTINFGSIPQTYRSLWIIGNVISPTSNNILWNYNGVSTSTYNYLYMENATGGASASTTRCLGGTTEPNGSSVVIKIPDYARTDKYKSSTSQTGTNTYVSTIGQVWQSTNAISSIAFTLSGANFVAGTTLTLYGLK